ncbi:hypothetical protein ACFPM0_23785 [Pseudonocardia sulfidoxydans]
MGQQLVVFRLGDEFCVFRRLVRHRGLTRHRNTSRPRRPTGT